MPFLVDTSILLRWSRTTDPDYILARDAVETLYQRGEQQFVTPQNLIEFWNVATRPSNNNGFGLSLSDAAATLTQIETFFILAPDSPNVYPEWRNLVQTVGVSGTQVHDARLAAHCRIHGITDIPTFNVQDFQRYPGLTAIHPSAFTPTP